MNQSEEITQQHHNNITSQHHNTTHSIIMGKQQQKSKSTHQSSDDDPPVSPQRKKMLISAVLWILYSVFRASLLLSLFVTLPSLLPALSESSGFLHMQEVLSLWSENIIVDVSIQQGEICNEGWEDPWGTWPGNVQGCSCTVGMGAWQYQLVFIGGCTAQEIAAGCTGVSAHNAIPYKYWGTNQHICIKRVQGFNFFTTQINLNQTQTQTNFNPNLSKCPSSTPSPDYTIDSISELKCPITSISTNLSLEEAIPDSGWSVKRGSGWPMAGVRIVIGGVCQWLKQEEGDAGLQQDYVLMAGNRGPCPAGDWRATTISTLDEQSLFNSNPAIISALSSLPACPPPSARKLTSLLFYSYPPWSYDCRTSSSFSLSTAHTNFLFNAVISSVRKYVAICGVVITVIALLMIWETWTKLSKWRTTQSGEWMGVRERRRAYPHYQKPDSTSEAIKFMAILLLSVACMISLSLLHSYLSDMYAWYLASYVCTNPSLSVWISSYLEEMALRMKFAMGMIGGILGVIAVEVGWWIWRKHKGDLKNDQDEDQDRKIQLQMKQQIEIKQISENETLSEDKSKESCIQQTEQVLLQQSFNLSNSIFTSNPAKYPRPSPLLMNQMISDTISQMSN